LEQLLFDPEGINAQGSRIYVASFVPNNTGTPTSLTGYGVTSVAYAATGIFKLQLDDSNFKCLLNASGFVQAAAGGAGDGFQLNLDATNTSLANGVIAFVLLNTSNARAALAGDANCRVYVRFELSKHYNDVGGP
jgi:hypothetical protein